MIYSTMVFKSHSLSTFVQCFDSEFRSLLDINYSVHEYNRDCEHVGGHLIQISNN